MLTTMLPVWPVLHPGGFAAYFWVGWSRLRLRRAALHKYTSRPCGIVQGIYSLVEGLLRVFGARFGFGREPAG